MSSSVSRHSSTGRSSELLSSVCPLSHAPHMAIHKAWGRWGPSVSALWWCRELLLSCSLKQAVSVSGLAVGRFTLEERRGVRQRGEWRQSKGSALARLAAFLPVCLCTFSGRLQYCSLCFLRCPHLHGPPWRRVTDCPACLPVLSATATAAGVVLLPGVLRLPPATSHN